MGFSKTRTEDRRRAGTQIRIRARLYVRQTRFMAETVFFFLVIFFSPTRWICVFAYEFAWNLPFYWNKFNGIWRYVPQSAVHGDYGA